MDISKILQDILSEQLVLDIKKNMDSAKNFGSRYGQDVEPKGTYVTVGHTTMSGYKNGKAVLQNPLFIDVDDNNLIEYKRELSNKFKAKGLGLTKKLMTKGYDSLITRYSNGDFGEIVLFPNASFMLH